MGKFKNLVGEKFGRLLIVEFFKMGNQGSIWKCQCDCGKIVYRSIGALASGNTTSCGCYRLERVRDSLLMDITGMKFGEWTVIEPDFSQKGQGHTKWRCKCSCGTIAVISGKSIRTGASKRCRTCAGKRAQKKRSAFEKALRRVLGGMKSRCRCISGRAYERYGGRGITVCDEWHSFEKFYEWAISAGYLPGMTIERIDNNKGYSPENCKWATYAEQNKNKRSNKKITINGETKILNDWLLQYNRPRATYKTRIKLGWNEIDAIVTPARSNL